MSDWTDEVKARLEREEERLRLKAANLQERHGVWSLMAQQELTVADDIRSALKEVERLGEPCLPTCIPPDVHDMHCTRAYLTRAITAEAKLAEEAAAHDRTAECRAIDQRQRDEAEMNLILSQAEVERLRCIISPGDAAAFEEHMAAREAHWMAQVERLRGSVEYVRGWAFEHGFDGLEEMMSAALRGGGE